MVTSSMHFSETGPINFNNSKYLLLHTDNGCGWHFFDWSLQYLSGKERYYKFASQQWVPISNDPTLSVTAHNHQINYVYNIQQLEDFNSQVNKLNDAPVVLQNGINFHTLNKNCNPRDLTVEQRQELDQKVIYEITQLANRASELGFRLITLTWSPEHRYIPVYQIRQAHRYDTGQIMESDCVLDNWLETFFPGSANYFDSTLWDRRELAAVNMRIDNTHNTKIDFIRQQIPKIKLYTTQEFWYNADHIFNCNNIQFENWKQVYNKWQKIHDIQLSVDYEKILDAIVTGKSLDMTRYNLNFLKEAFIQHGLIYRYNLNLKNWKLEHFPNDTLQLHQLLEHNIHYRDPTYCENFLEKFYDFRSAQS